MLRFRLMLGKHVFISNYGPRQIALGVPGAKQDNVFFPDINGDGRADYAVFGGKGEVNLWLNTTCHTTATGLALTRLPRGSELQTSH